MEPSVNRVKLLLVEDNAFDAELLWAGLARTAPGTFEVIHAQRLERALDLIRNQRFDVILLDLSLPDGKGLPTFARVRETTPKTPIVVLTGLDDEEVAMQAVRNGAQDYLVKGRANAQLVTRSIRYAFERSQMYEFER